MAYLIKVKTIVSKHGTVRFTSLKLGVEWKKSDGNMSPTCFRRNLATIEFH